MKSKVGSELVSREWHIEAHAHDDDEGHWWHIGDNFKKRDDAVWFMIRVLRAKTEMKRTKFRLVRMDTTKTVEESE